jgi:hypothetical protein
VALGAVPSALGFAGGLVVHPDNRDRHISPARSDAISFFFIFLPPYSYLTTGIIDALGGFLYYPS